MENQKNKAPWLRTSPRDWGNRTESWDRTCTTNQGRKKKKRADRKNIVREFPERKNSVKNWSNIRSKRQLPRHSRRENPWPGGCSGRKCWKYSKRDKETKNMQEAWASGAAVEMLLEALASHTKCLRLTPSSTCTSRCRLSSWFLVPGLAQPQLSEEFGECTGGRRSPCVHVHALLPPCLPPSPRKN